MCNGNLHIGQLFALAVPPYVARFARIDIDIVFNPTNTSYSVQVTAQITCKEAAVFSFGIVKFKPEVMGKISVALVGATGETGKSILNGLLEDGTFASPLQSYFYPTLMILDRKSPSSFAPSLSPNPPPKLSPRAASPSSPSTPPPPWIQSSLSPSQSSLAQ